MIPILYDGWPLSYSRSSPGALHLLTLLEAHPGNFEPLVALPASPPEWFPKDIPIQLSPTSITSHGRLTWEQRSLPEIARRAGAKLVHLTTSTPALFASVPHVISPAGFVSDPGTWKLTGGREGSRKILEPGQTRGLAERLRLSLSRGAQAQVLAVFWPDDLPIFENMSGPGRMKRLPPVVHPAFFIDQKDVPVKLFPDLPEAYLLYHGPYNHLSIQCLLDAWSWAAGPIGESCPLVLVGADSLSQSLGDRLRESGLEHSIKILPSLPPEELAHLYRSCTSLVHLGPLSVWGGPVRHALACGRPVIAVKSALAEALVGPAAYLIPEKDSRGIGAAMITVAVQAELEESLSQAARVKSKNWDLALFRESLAKAYQDLTVRDE